MSACMLCGAEAGGSDFCDPCEEREQRRAAENQSYNQWIADQEEAAQQAKEEARNGGN